MAEETYFMDQDSSCHWYVVPRSKETEWSKWRNLDEDNEEAWDAPKWATQVGGSPTLVTFTGTFKIG